MDIWNYQTTITDTNNYNCTYHTSQNIQEWIMDQYMPYGTGKKFTPKATSGYK